MLKVRVNVELYYTVGDDEDLDRIPVDFQVYRFNSGELQLKDFRLPAKATTYDLFLLGTDNDSFIAFQLLRDLINRTDAINLTMNVPYMPAARSDRGEYAALPTYYRMLEPQGPKEVLSMLDVHNPDALPVIPAVANHSARSVIMEVMDTNVLETYDGIIAPDEGAEERASWVARGLQLPCHLAFKSRDFETGEILGSAAPNDLPQSGHFLVVDDICDGGRTFAGLIDVIKETYPEADHTFDLWVTHGAFGYYAHMTLAGKFRKVYTTNSHPNAHMFDGHDEEGNPYGIDVEVFDIRPFMMTL